MINSNEPDSGRTTASARLIGKQSNNFSTVLTIQNVSNSTANFTVEFKPNNGGASTTVIINNVPVQLTTENTPGGVGNGDFLMAHGLFTR